MSTIRDRVKNKILRGDHLHISGDAASHITTENDLKINGKTICNAGGTGLTLSASGVMSLNEAQTDILSINDCIINQCPISNSPGISSSPLNNCTIGLLTPAQASFTEISSDLIKGGPITLDSSTNITLDSADGTFVIKNNDTEFSVANSAFAGTILGFRCIGENAADASLSVSTSYSVLNPNFTVRFVAPPSGNVEVMVQVYADTVTSNRSLYFALSNLATYSSIGAQYENKVSYPDESDDGVIQHFWVITGLTPNSIYNYWLGTRTSAISKTLRWGGNSTNEYPTFIMKVTALPHATAGFAVYG